MTQRAHLRAQSYAERMEAHWASLPLERKVRVLLYLASRLVRALRSEIDWRSMRAHLLRCSMCLRAALCGCVDDARQLLRAENRAELISFVRSVPTLQSVLTLGPAFAGILFLEAWIASLGSGGADVVAQARAAEAMRPPPCYLAADGEVWIDAEGGPIRPNRPDYAERRLEICGF